MVTSHETLCSATFGIPTHYGHSIYIPFFDPFHYLSWTLACTQANTPCPIAVLPFTVNNMDFSIVLCAYFYCTLINYALMYFGFMSVLQVNRKIELSSKHIIIVKVGGIKSVIIMQSLNLIGVLCCYVTVIQLSLLQGE